MVVIIKHILVKVLITAGKIILDIVERECREKHWPPKKEQKHE
jgi:hypothetical protein